jgi:gentisate 1,2-dioxygenase
MDARSAATGAPARDAQAFYKELERNHLVALWNVNKGLLPKEPRSRCVAHLWRWETMLPLVRQGAEVAPLSRDAERRVLGFINPGLPDRFGATHTLWAGFQYVLPGEVAPAHRHSPAAIRFVIDGEGAFTTVDGDKCVMGRGDLVLTPPWTWHDHGNDSSRPMLWLDGLDLPMVGELEGQFYEPFAADAQPIVMPVGDSERRRGIGQLRPTWETWVASHSPLLNYKWDRTAEALRRLASVAGSASAFDDVAMEYVNPHTGGPLMPTIACWIQLLRPGIRTKAHRETGSAVYFAFEGRGHSVIDGQRFDWRSGDLFVVPTWAWHEHASDAREAILFSVRDTPVMQALGLHREQAYQEHGGHQPITRVFEG